MIDIFSNLDKINKLIQTGDLKKAKKLALDVVDPQQIYGPDFVYYCSLLRRLRLSSKALGLLQPLIYPKSRSVEIATVEEKLEYAANLVSLGASSEAERILNQISEDEWPLVLIRKSFLSISRWDYETSNRLLLQYIQHPFADAYNILVAKVNLLQGYVVLEKTDLASKMFDELIGELELKKYKLLLAAVYEFGAELCRIQKKFAEGLRYIKMGKDLLSAKNSVDLFLLEKQKFLLSIYQKLIPEHELEYQNLKRSAQKLKHYESLRDLDFHWAVVNKNTRLLNKSYWGSLSSSYKERIIRYSEHYCLNLNIEQYVVGKPNKIKFDMKKKNFVNCKVKIKSGQALSRLLFFLVSEFYKPIRLIDIFDKVYPSEIYIPGYSDDKVHQLLRRFRLFIKNAGLSMSLNCENDIYKLNFHQSCTLIDGGRVYLSSDAKLLIQHFGRKKFNIKDLAQFYDCSERTAIRRLNFLKKEGVIQSLGKTRSAMFRVKTARIVNPI